jgi:hypothetical protein
LLRKLRHRFLTKIFSSLYTHLEKPIAYGKPLALGKPMAPRHPIVTGKLRGAPLLGNERSLVGNCYSVWEEKV